MDNEIEIRELNQSIDKIMGRKAHVWITLKAPGATEKIQVKALLDTGNTIKEETAITEELHNKLKVGLQEMGGAPIGTANREGPKLKKYGVSNPIEIFYKIIYWFSVMVYKIAYF